jgi:membrane protease YdiL (CAAX protease family)
VLGAAFGWLALGTTNLGAPIAAHFTINFLNLRFITMEPAVLLRGSRPAA